MPDSITPELVNEQIKTDLATAAFLLQKTTISVRRVEDYGLAGNQRHAKGLPFIILPHMPSEPFASSSDRPVRSKILMSRMARA